MDMPTFLTLVGFGSLVVFVAWGLRSMFGSQEPDRDAILEQPFPPAWEQILQSHVAFYATLPADEQQRFRDRLQIFLDQKRITGIKTEIDDTTRVLVAASAVITAFGFDTWQWVEIREVLMYPQPFDHEYNLEDEDDSNLGLVGSEELNGVMILSQPDLIAGFIEPYENVNVGIHEFAHLLDKTDGSIDGLPIVGLHPDAVEAWQDLVEREMQRLEKGRSTLDPYGLTDESEFFAVASESFFSHPRQLQRDHPELFEMLEAIYNQDLGSRAREMSHFRGRQLRQAFVKRHRKVLHPPRRRAPRRPRPGHH